MFCDSKENCENWKELCELATQEKDPKKLMALIGEIDRLLETKEHAARKPPGLVLKNRTKKAG